MNDFETRLAKISFPDDASWQDALNTAHSVIRLAPKLEALGIISAEQIQRCWDIQTAASGRGLVPKHTPSAWEREYKSLLEVHGLLNASGQYQRGQGGAETSNVGNSVLVGASTSSWFKRVT